MIVFESESVVWGNLLESFHQDSRACRRHLRACHVYCSVLVNQHSEKLISTKYFIRVCFTLGFCLAGFWGRFQFTVRGVFKLFFKNFDLYFNGAFKHLSLMRLPYVRYLLT